MAAAKAEVHPDPNLLSAFTEKLLAKDERLRVMEHLAQCSDCREVVTLSIPEFEPATAIAAVQARSPWLAWPVLRWGTLAACVVVVGVGVMLHHLRQENAQPLVAARQVVTVPESRTTPEVRAVQPSGTELGPNVGSRPLPEARRDTATASVEKLPEASSYANLAAPRARTSTAAPALSAKMAIPQLRNQARLPELSQVAPSANPAESADVTANSELAELMPGRAKDAIQAPRAFNPAPGMTGETLGPGEIASNNANDSLLPTTPNLTPRWTLSADGTLQRSLDSGRSWKTITVSNRTIFRALAANGLDIWVGGSGGALYHSSDAGEHWVRLQPVANGESLAADIIGVEFTDILHGKVTTSQETWTTADCGQTWEKQ